MALDRDRLLKPVRKLRKLMRKLDRQPAPDQVHDLRTNTRRMEAAFEALSLDRQGVGKSVMKDLRRCRKRAGRVRDMDVLTDYASTVQLEGEQDCRVRLLENLGARRQKYANKLYREVRQLRSSLRKELRRTGDKIAELAETHKGEARGRATGSTAAATALTLAVQLALPERLNRDNLHPYRLKVKELRNVLQMAQGGKGEKFTDDLAQVKDAIGEWHDWQELLSIAEKELDHGNRCGLLSELKKITGQKYDHALALTLALRKSYLRDTDKRKKSSSAVSSSIPREMVWGAIAKLAG